MCFQRWAVTSTAFNYSVRSVPSSQNAEMDALSRLLSPSTLDHEAAYDFEERLISSLPITYKEITPRHTCWLHPITVVNLCQTRVASARFELFVEQDCLLWGLRVNILSRYQNDILEELHIGHQGIVRMKELVRSYVCGLTWTKGWSRRCSQELKKNASPSPTYPMVMAE